MLYFFVYAFLILAVYFVLSLKIMHIDTAYLRKYCAAKSYKLLNWSYNPYYHLMVDKFLLYGGSGVVFHLIAQDQFGREIRGWVRCDKRGARFAGDDGPYDQTTFIQ